MDDPSNADAAVMARERRGRGVMDDPRWEPGMPVLDRQAIGADARRIGSPRPQPTPLQKHYINLSAIALVAGRDRDHRDRDRHRRCRSPLVKLCVLIARPDLRRHDRRRGAAVLAQRLGLDADRPRRAACSG